MKRYATTLTLGLLVALSGCGGDDSGDASSSNSSSDRLQVSEGSQSNFISPSGENFQSPALKSTVANDSLIPGPIIPIDSTPEQVVGHFMNALWNTDTAKAEQLLTEKARTEIRKTQWGLVAFDSENATYEVQIAQFVTSEKKRCQVNCQITSTDPSNLVKYPIAWTLKRQAHNGWRVSGSVIFDNKTASPMLVEFEDAVTFEDTMNHLNGVSEIRQATQSDTTTIR